MTQHRLLLVLAGMLVVGLSASISHAQGAGTATSPEPKGRNCRMEQQCKWVNFKKVCTYVKVCR